VSARACGLAVAVVVLVARASAEPPSEDRRAAARARYIEGSKFYDTGRYLEAAAEYERAFLLVDEPSLLFNMGQAFRLGGDAARALRSYRAFLRRVPDAADRESVARRIDELERQLEAAKATQAAPPQGTRPLDGAPTAPRPPPPEPRPPPPEPPSPPRLQIAPVPQSPPFLVEKSRNERSFRARRGPAFGSGVGLCTGALAAGAIGVALLAWSATLAPPTTTLGDFERAQSDRRNFQIAGGALAGVAALAAAGGVVSLVIWSRGAHR
jgi:tetratricopeptide (TPR) repeat protein